MSYAKVSNCLIDGEFDSSDLVAVFITGQYEDDVPLNSVWGTGDWDADGDFTTSDLVVAFTDGGYERGPRPSAMGVPEPGSSLMLLAGLFGLATRRRNCAH